MRREKWIKYFEFRLWSTNTGAWNVRDKNEYDIRAMKHHDQVLYILIRLLLEIGSRRGSGEARHMKQKEANA